MDKDRHHVRAFKRTRFATLRRNEFESLTGEMSISEIIDFLKNLNQAHA
jgi:hypothetical protein